MSEKLSERERMPAVIDGLEPKELIRLLPDPSIRFSVKAAMNSAARQLPWTFNRVKDIWYGDSRAKVSHEEFKQLRAAVERVAHNRSTQKAAVHEREVADELQRVRREVADLRRQLEARMADRPR
jgi:hypothetical protein